MSSLVYEWRRILEVRGPGRRSIKISALPTTRSRDKRLYQDLDICVTFFSKRADSALHSREFDK